MSAVTDIGDSLRANPRSYSALSSGDKLTLHAAMRPDDLHGFNSEQLGWLYSWLLEVSPEQLEALQALHANQYTAREALDETLYLGADLLTDALDGRRLSAAETILTNLTLVHVSNVSFPAPPTEDE